MVSAQIQRGDLADQVGPQLSDGPYPLTGANTILVLGSDARSGDLAEPGTRRPEPLGLDHAAADRRRRQRHALDPARHGGRHPRPRQNKINAAYAFGGPALATQTVKQFLGVEINHVVEVSFENFPELIDALGGVTYKGDAVLSKINGGNAQRRLHAPAAQGQDGDQRQAGARARPHAQEPEQSRPRTT